MPNRFSKLSVVFLMAASAMPVFAAQPVDLEGKNAGFLRTLIPSITPAIKAAVSGDKNDMQEISQSVDFNQTLHVRVQQTYAGYPVHGADAVMHFPHGTKNTHLRSLVASPAAANASMSGTLYQDLAKDLQDAPAIVFSKDQADRALAQAISNYELKTGIKAQVESKESKLMVYIDDANKAHWAFRVQFYTKVNGMPSIPVSIMDAVNFTVFKQWNNVQTLENVEGGGLGGNRKMGKLFYDGETGHLGKLDLQRDNTSKTCYLKNDSVTVTDFRNNKIASFRCEKPDSQHDNLYWNEGADKINGAFSPNNDALYDGKVIVAMYKDWYGVPVLKEKNGDPMVLAMETHAVITDEETGEVDYDNAAWDSEKNVMFFCDGRDFFYPLTSLGIGAHEISHGFTQQHSNLEYDGQPGGMNESFSDMAAQAAEFYSSHSNTWKIGEEVTLQAGMVLRYMDVPSRDCKNIKRGQQCSIDNVANFTPKLDVHFTSGIYNRVFYLLSTSEGWDVRKAFDVMVQANSHYWTETTTFKKGACGVMSAAKDYKYDTKAVSKAFADVGIDTSSC